MAARRTRGGARRGAGRGATGRPFLLRLSINWRVVLDAAALVSIVLGVVCVLALTFPTGQVTAPLLRWSTLGFGWIAPVVPVWLVGLGFVRLLAVLRPEGGVPTGRLVGGLLATLALPALVHLMPLGDSDPAVRAFEQRAGGGAIGFLLSGGLAEALGPAAAVSVLLGALALGLLLLFDLSLTQVVVALGTAGILIAGTLLAAWRAARERLSRPALRINRPMADAARPKPLARRLAQVALGPGTQGATGEGAADEPQDSAPRPAEAEWRRPRDDRVPADASIVDPPPPTADRPWRLPSSGLFAAASAVELSQADVRSQARVIEETLASFNIHARVAEVNSGPTVTQFGLEPAPGVTVSRILARGNDLALRLGATSLRMEAPVPGKRVVGVEVPNRAGAMVSLRELLESTTWAKTRSKLRLALGRDVSGNAVIGDLAKMPHLLIAGATGSGKSVCINSIVASLIYQSTPDDLQFVMIDPKMVELVGFNGIPHLRMPVVTDMDRVVGSLKWVVREMERRYKLFAERSARNIEAYNKLIEARGDAAGPAEKRMPFLVVVIDELADMMMTAGDEVERILCRLAQLARATGIHLVVATQRPSVDVITGLIKANFPTRISFAVSSHIDSRTILDTAGAEKLLGRGDMLFLPQDSGKPTRVQGAYVSDDEMHRLVEFWRKLGGPRYSDEEVKEIEALGADEDEDGDELFDKAVTVAQQYRRVSASLLQRRLGIGYPRAARLVDLLEERGIVGPSEDGKSREVVEREPVAIE